LGWRCVRCTEFPYQLESRLSDETLLLETLCLISCQLYLKISHESYMKRSSLVKPMISLKSKPNASKTWSKVDCK
jgi:hypothetical protein